ncbi:hypothetical protein E0H26_04060 [Micromonospora zingiberis]|uniref:DUF3592 domain-containing protein n=2 Tax=Micromonospora zingiberis TaxID=2053011 RepID=A0A4R0GQX0_9ACTN|nr:hypothetical protein E0H26_04060 [Micromonospora zingiberis]
MPPETLDAGTPEAPAPAAVEVEPTTGAPVDALPRRVPVRSAGRRDHPTDAGTPEQGDTFWAPIEQVHWDGTPVRQEESRPWWRPAWPVWRRRERARHPPDPLVGLAALVGLSLAAAFFAWVSAGPFWLAVGHATSGTVVVTDCTGGGLSQRCRGIFTAADERFRTHGVRVSGVPERRATSGAVLPARVTGPDADTAYADRGVGAHLRWLLGLLALLGCAAGIVRWTGATRLPDPNTRRWAVAAGFAGPLVIALGFLVAAW